MTVGWTRRSRTLLLLAAMVGVVVAGACGGGGGSPATASSEATATPSQATTTMPTETETAGPSTPPLPAALQQLLEGVAAIRQLSPPPSVRITTIAPGDVAAELERQLQPEDLRSFRDSTTLYRLLGHLRPDQDMKSIYLSFAGSGGYIGFYSSVAKALWVVGDGSGAVDFGALTRGQKETLAHELVHAIQDFHFNLSQVYLKVVSDLDRNLISGAVQEGDAVVHSQLYAEKYLALPVGGTTRVLLANLPAALADVPQSIIREFYFPYTTGADWLREIRDRYGTSQIDQMLADPPAGTAYALHPELMDAGFKPASVSLPDLAQVLGQGWERQSGGTFGEFELRNYLQLRIRALDASAAAAGWAGDHYDVYVNGADSVAAFRVHFKDQAEADQFAKAHADFIDSAGARLQKDGLATIAQLPGGNVTVTTPGMGPDVLFVIGSNADVARKAMRALSGG